MLIFLRSRYDCKYDIPGKVRENTMDFKLNYILMMTSIINPSMD